MHGVNTNNLLLGSYPKESLPSQVRETESQTGGSAKSIGEKKNTL